jgi:hypothetical protein
MLPKTTPAAGRKTGNRTAQQNMNDPSHSLRAKHMEYGRYL